MKKILLFLIPLCFIFSVASAEKWELVTKDANQTSFFVDIDQLDIIKENLHHKDPDISKRTEQSIKRIWIKVVIIEPKIITLIILSEYDFAQNKFRTTYSNISDKDGNFLAEKVNDNNPWQTIPEGDTRELISKYVKNYLSLK